jgi:hypothetical protein
MTSSPPSHDLFLAHAEVDRAAAEELFDRLAPEVRPWLDTRSLLLGDEWAVEIPRAQRAALATVILVSRNADHAFYLRDEIHTAIALHRAFPGEHRAVAVYLDGRPSDPTQVPFGLRVLHGLDAVSEGGLAGVARKLRELVVALRGRGARVPPLDAGAGRADAGRGDGGPTSPVDKQQLYDLLRKLTLGAQLEAVIRRAGLPREHIAPPAASLAQRALDIAQIAADGGPALAARVADAIAREAPWLAGAAAAAVAAASSAGGGGVERSARADGRVAVLLVFANPRGTDLLRLGTEERALRQSIQLAGHRDRFDVEALHAATVDDLRRALIAKARTIVHFSGHGKEDGLRFEDEHGNELIPDPTALGSLLRRRGVETVVLSACYSLSIVKDNPMGTRFTVAMDGRVEDTGALEFSRGFYDVLGAGGGVEEAYEEGLSCAALKNAPVKAELVRT